MLKTVTTKLTTLLMMALFTLPVFSLAPQVAYADSGSKQAACAGIGLTGSDSDGNCNGGAETKIGGVINTLVQILSWVVGIAAVIMIIIGGFKYVTSGGDSNAVSSAKSTLMYALVGIVIVALAQFIVHYVVNQLT